MCHRNKRYTSDLSDQQWKKIKAYLPFTHRGVGRPITINMREAVNAMFYVAKTGCQWANLPGEFPYYQSVYYHYRKWCREGVWERLNRALVYAARRTAGRCPHPSAAILDSQSAKTTGAGDERGYDGGKKVKGRKQHILVDTLGYLLTVVVHAASIQDRDGAKRVISALLPIVRLRLLKIWADGGYRGALIDWMHQAAHLDLAIVSAPPTQVGFAVLPRRWVVERTFAWLGHYRRLSKDYERDSPLSEGMVYLAAIHTLLKRTAA